MTASRSHSFRGRSIFAAAFLIGLSLLATACGGDPGTDTTSETTNGDATNGDATDDATGGSPAATTQASGPAKDVCELMTKEEAQTATGATIETAQNSGGNSGSSPGGYKLSGFCYYKATSDGIVRTVAEIITQGRKIDYTEGKGNAGANGKPVSGLGDDAYCSTTLSQSSKKTTIYVLKGEAWFGVSFVGDDISCEGTVKKLAEIVAPRF